MSNVVICAIAKNENLYLRDWVEYHKQLGIDRIFLYDNNDLCGERFEEVIKDYIDSRYVIVFDRRGIEKGLVFDENNINLQNKCYVETYNNLQIYSNYQWIFFIDIDEYIHIKEGTLEEYLNSEKYKKYDTIVFPWVIYNDNNKLRYTPGKLKDRFPTKADYISDNIFVKCCVRIGNNIKSPAQFLLLHFMILEGERVCYESGKPVNWIYERADYNKTGKPEKYKKVSYPVNEVEDCNVVINHYRYKTLEEYLIRQFKRHWGTGKHQTTKTKPLNILLNNFFKYNEITTEKNKVILKLRKLILSGKVIANLYFKNNNQIYNILDKIKKQSYKPTHILIHVKDKELKNSIDLSDYKGLNIIYYYDIDNPNYPSNTLIKVNDLKYKICLDENTNYDDQFLKTQVIKALFE